MDLSKIKKEDITLKNIKAIVSGNVNNTLNKLGMLDEEFAQVIEERKSLCPECNEKGSCIVCGCTFETMVSAPNKTCPNGRWGAYNKNDKYLKNNKLIYDIDLSETNEFTIRHVVDKNLIVSELELTCGCVGVTKQTFEDIEDNNELKLYLVTLQFDKERFAVNQQKFIHITFEHVDKKQLNATDQFKMITLKRIK